MGFFSCSLNWKGKTWKLCNLVLMLTVWPFNANWNKSSPLIGYQVSPWPIRSLPSPLCPTFLNLSLVRLPGCGTLLSTCRLAVRIVCVCVCVLHTAASVCMNVWTDLEVKWQLLFSSSERKCIFSLGRKDMMMMMVIKTLKMMMGVPRPPRAQVSGCWYSVELFCGIYVCVLLRILLLSQTARFWFPVSSPFFVCCMFCMSFTPRCSSVVLHF